MVEPFLEGNFLLGVVGYYGDGIVDVTSTKCLHSLND